MFSPDGSCIASGSSDKSVRVWNFEPDGTATARPLELEGHTSSLTSLAFSKDGRWIVSGSQDGTVRVWHSATGSLVAGPFEGHIASINSVAFSPDSGQIVSGSKDSTIRVWKHTRVKRATRVADASCRFLTTEPPQIFTFEPTLLPIRLAPHFTLSQSTPPP
ncbi:WD40-repeat-containing domain protein [Mycena capillaripes]|nr:WD40-repeat-containing domain protein [Mycena capillaripes]